EENTRPGVGTHPDAEHEADSPVIDDDASSVVHEHRPICVWALDQCSRDLIVADENSGGRTPPPVARGRRWDVSPEDVREPLIRRDERWPSNKRGDQAIDRADADPSATTVAAQDFIEFIIAIGPRPRRAARASARAAHAAFQFQASNSCSSLFFVRPETIRSNMPVR